MPDQTNAPDPTGSASWVVSQTDLASELAEPGEAFPEVFPTSRMIALMELAASGAMRNQRTATPFGATVRAQARFVGKGGKVVRVRGRRIGRSGRNRARHPPSRSGADFETSRQRPKTAVVPYPLTASPQPGPFRHPIPSNPAPDWNCKHLKRPGLHTLFARRISKIHSLA